MLPRSGLSKFVYGLPELHRAELGTACYVSGVGCNATASKPGAAAMVKPSDPLFSPPWSRHHRSEGRLSESGAEGNAGSHHAERANVIRTFSAFGHRTTWEVIQELGLKDVTLTMTAVDLVRGVLASAHARVKSGVTNKGSVESLPGRRRGKPLSSAWSRTARHLSRAGAKVLSGRTMPTGLRAG